MMAEKLKNKVVDMTIQFLLLLIQLTCQERFTAAGGPGQ